MKYWALLVSAAAFTSGCVSSPDKPSWGDRQAMKALSAPPLISDEQRTVSKYLYTDDPKIPGDTGEFAPFKKTFYDSVEHQSSTTMQKKLRNEMICDLIRVSDRRFSVFTTTLQASSATFDTVSDLTASVLSTTASIATGGYTPRILSGVSGFISGGKSTIEKNFLAEKTIPALINVMSTNRLTKEKSIIDSEAKEYSDYSLVQALSDLEAMNAQGNLVVAIEDLNSTTAADKNTAVKVTDEAANNLAKKGNSKLE